ncbi:MAG: acyl-CoA dehydratase activase [Coriobacteriia bacterium]|nr:acyl-CoA dehydratase activase [Coriobacteriia bacterium]
MDTRGKHQATDLFVGLDIGSTTTKAVALDAHTQEMLYSIYRRHHAHQVESLADALADLAQRFPDARFHVAMSGSGGKSLANLLGIRYLQEVVANSIAVQTLYPNTRCAIELGGQDAKMIFFDHDPNTGALQVNDMRMNGSCAGGTGAFLDEIATLLKTPIEELNDLAARGETLYSISGRCGVYAKTDIQPLLNQGVTKEDIALSTFHAVAKQTLGGLAQGLDIHAPVIFEGGPLTFNPQLVNVFAERLQLEGDDIIIPKNPEVIVAQGAALSLGGMFAEEDTTADLDDLQAKLASAPAALAQAALIGDPFFTSEAELKAFQERHKIAPAPAGVSAFSPGDTVRVYLGMDSGSTTTKFALVDETGALVDSFYANNEGEPLDIARAALSSLNRRYRDAGVNLQVLACGTTGYGEMLFHKALHADIHMVETVAHSFAAARSVPDASFILDIGGQDMKAIWINDGIVTDILVNEACSSGCGSFLENFARSLNIPTREIAAAAFRSTNPAVLGSRCTVFMNSSVVTEQKNGKSPDDIMAGLCRSIIENVFTKVIRVSNLASLGERVVVQGGTFSNDAVLAAFEQYIGREVTRAPYPGLMGAIGAALLAQRHVEERIAADGAYTSTFIGLDAVSNLSYTQQANSICPFCGNACSRSVITFQDGSTFVSGNRCERGQVVGDPKDASVREAAKAARAQLDATPNLYKLREKLLFKRYPVEALCEERGITIGLPRALALWDNAPFWTTFWRALGFSVKLSRSSNRPLFENGLPAVASDTICFPAKLVHGHIRNLVEQGVDRIFMPVITTVESENTVSTSESMCAVVKGYPMVIRNSDNPERRFGVKFDDPLWHWYTAQDRERQLCSWMEDVLGVEAGLVKQAIAQADAAQASFRSELLDAGKRLLDDVQAEGRYAVVLASRPYHNDPLVNHDLPDQFAAQGIPVLPADAVPGATEIDLMHSRLDIVNNFHARTISTAILAAQKPYLEYAQVVSFGCGHDAYLTDEIIRIMHELSDKTPLVLKVDESDIAGPLRIRVRSFIETVNMRRASRSGKTTEPAPEKQLADPYPQKFEKADRKDRVVLIPNTSHAFSRMMAAVFGKQGLRAVPLELGREEAIRLGKKYVHNDICFPAQIVIGEALAELETGKYKNSEVAVVTGKYIGDCRLTHYAALLRKALDEAGYTDVPLLTNDDVDAHNQQPGWRMNTVSAIRIAMALPPIDALEELVRKIRPYELVPGSANEAFDRAMDVFIEGLQKHGTRGATRGFKRAIEIMKEVKYDRSQLRPRVLIVGEYLLNFHPGANHDVEQYLEDNGFEIIEARMTDVIRKSYFFRDAQIKEYGVSKPFGERTWLDITNRVFEHAHDVCDRIASAHPLYEPPTRMPELVQASDPIIHHTFDAGEGVLIPGEILHHAAHGCEAFLILQPFGCLPNHIVGRGISKRLKELYPNVQILPLDYDPDVSFANLENRLQMLVMNVQGKQAPRIPADQERAAAAKPTAHDDNQGGGTNRSWTPKAVPGCAEADDDLVGNLAAAVAEIAREAVALASETATRAAANQALQAKLAQSRINGLVAEVRGKLAELDQLAIRANSLSQSIHQQAAMSADEALARVDDAAIRLEQVVNRAHAEATNSFERLGEFAQALNKFSTDSKRNADESLASTVADIQSYAERVAKKAARIRTEADEIARFAEETARTQHTATV